MGIDSCGMLISALHHEEGAGPAPDAGPSISPPARSSTKTGCTSLQACCMLLEIITSSYGEKYAWIVLSVYQIQL